MEMTLKELCSKVGVSRRTIQRYEVFGLISASGKTSRGYLLYDDTALEIAKRIKEYQMFGFTLNEIRNLHDISNQDRKELLLTKLEILKHNKEILQETIIILEQEINEL